MTEELHFALADCSILTKTKKSDRYMKHAFFWSCYLYISSQHLNFSLVHPLEAIVTNFKGTHEYRHLNP